MVIIIQYEIKLIDGSVMIGDELIEQMYEDVSKYILIKYEKDNNKISVLYSLNVMCVNLINLSEEELDDELTKINDYLKRITANCNCDDDVDDGDVDPEDDPTESFNFTTPVNFNMYG